MGLNIKYNIEILMILVTGELRTVLEQKESVCKVLFYKNYSHTIAHILSIRKTSHRTTVEN